MSLSLVTGYKGKGHITSADDACRNAAFLGEAKYVTQNGQQFKASINTNNNIIIYDGDAFNQGRHIHIPSGETEEVEISTLSKGLNRIDLIVIRYTKETVTGYEECELVVIEGKATSGTATQPSYTSGIIFAGALIDDMPLYRVNLVNGSISSVEPMFNVIMPMSEMQSQLTQLSSSLLSWKYIDFVKGNKAITIPDSAKEINVAVLFNNDKDIISFVFARESILSGRFFRQGYYANQDAYGSASIECVTDSSIHLYAMYRNGVDITANTSISVRYR
ncbi:MAG: hypothetical protein Q4D45_13025 [Lachnospiraceae bacterium]|nr:hypothetical protein [Lachnospiraceae bacterium]